MKHNNFEEAFIAINKDVMEYPEHSIDSRNGVCKEILGYSYGVINPLVREFLNPAINRIDYDYADRFYSFMVSGGGFDKASDYFTKEDNVDKFIQPQKGLPENFNTLYGPRIISQIPAVTKELKNNPNTRRACIMILREEDNILYEEPDGLEYPCTESIQFFCRGDAIYMHVNMRSQNTAVVMQLDMYLASRLLEDMCDILAKKCGGFTCSIGSAHIFNRDFDYIGGFIK